MADNKPRAVARTGNGQVITPEQPQHDQPNLDQENESQVEIEVLRDELEAMRNDFNLLNQEKASQDRQMADLSSLLDLSGVPRTDQSGVVLTLDERLMAQGQQSKTVRRALEDLREDITRVLFTLAIPATVANIADVRKIVAGCRTDLKQAVESSQKAALILVINQSND